MNGNGGLVGDRRDGELWQRRALRATIAAIAGGVGLGAIAAAGSAQGARCRRVTEAEGLAVRAAASPAAAAVGSLDPGDRVTLAEGWRNIPGPEGRNWVAIAAPVRGFVSNGFPGSTGNLGHCEAAAVPSRTAPAAPPEATARPMPPAVQGSPMAIDGAVEGYRRGLEAGRDHCQFQGGYNPAERPFAEVLGENARQTQRYIEDFNQGYRSGYDDGYRPCRSE